MAYYRWANTYITITYPYLIIISTPTFYLCSFVLFTPPVNIITYPYPHFLSARSPTYQYYHLPLPPLYICSFPHLSILSPTLTHTLYLLVPPPVNMVPNSSGDEEGGGEGVGSCVCMGLSWLNSRSSTTRHPHHHPLTANHARTKRHNGAKGNDQSNNNNNITNSSYTYSGIK